MLNRLGLIFVGTCFALAIGEIALRLGPSTPFPHTVAFGWFDWLVYDPILGWTNKAGYENPQFRINDLTLRGDQVSAKKRPGVLRIICLGDSRTFGVWADLQRIRFDNDYPSMLGSILRSNSGLAPTEVINAGVVGYTSAHGLRQFITRLSKLKPDVIVVAFGFNDHLLSWNPALRSPEPRGILGQELLYNFADMKIFELGMTVYRRLEARDAAPLTVREVDLEEYAYNLRRFATVAAENGTRLLLLSQSIRPIEMGESVSAFASAERPREEQYALLGAKDLTQLHQIHRTYQDTLSRVARELSIPVADASAAFNAHQGEPLFGPYDLVHCNVTGARVIARTLSEKLEELGWLGNGGVGGSS